MKAHELVDKDVRKEVDQRSAVESKMTYLLSVISEKGDASLRSNTRKSSALTLIGEVSGTNAIHTLIENLTFMDQRYNGFPASRALVKIGEPAVPELLKVVRDSPDQLAPGSLEEDKVRWAVMTLGFIKAKNWQSFLELQQRQLRKNAWARLAHYAIVTGF